MNESTTAKIHLPRVKFQVTAENIQDACRADSRHCMIAEAVAAQLPQVRNVSVDMMTIRWSDPTKGWRYIYLTPQPAQEALVKYDMGLEIKPFSFQVRSGHATPMILGSGKDRKRAHKIRGSKIVKASDKGTVIHSVGSESVPMWPGQKDAITRVGRDTIPILAPHKKLSPGRPKSWHPSHNSLRQFGLRGFTKGYIKKPE